MNARDVALVAVAAGLSVVPPVEDGSKRPEPQRLTRDQVVRIFGANRADELLGRETTLLTWEHWQVIRPDRERIERWYGNGRTGVGIVCGRVSGNLEMIEFDDADVYQRFKDTAEAADLGDLIERIEAGYLEATPGGGFHWPYFCSEVAGNTKLAQRPGPPDEGGKPTRKAIIETRGEGGYFISAPSNGRVHPSGGHYRLLRGDIRSIARITPDERSTLFDLARAFDEMPRPCVVPASEPASTWSLRPGDDFNGKVSWRDVLEPSGWVRVFERGDEEYWRRPGKERGISATTNYKESGFLYVFSTSTDFDSERGYSKFSAFAILNHSGDFIKAARDLHTKGYGVAGDTVPAFPLETLPTPLRVLVVEAANSLVAPPDFVAVPLLVAAGAVIGNTLELELKPGWREGANLYAAVVGDPGTKKSPSIGLAMRPLYQVQKRLHRAFDSEMDEYKEALATWEGAKKAGRGPKPEFPSFHHVVTTDATTEAVAAALQASKGIILMKDELTGWVRAMDQYRSGGKGADRQHYLSMWSRSLIKVDRKSNPIPLVVERPHLSVIGGIQPDLLGELGDSAQREDGFLDRLLWSYPEKVSDHWTTEGTSLEAVRQVEAIFDRLYRLEGVRLNDDVSPSTVTLSKEAAQVWSDWYAEHVAETESDGLSRRLVGPWAKMPAQLARLALIIHATNDPRLGMVQAETIAAAADLIDYFKAHARRVYRLLGAQRRDRIITLLQALKESGPLNQRSILHDVFKRNVPAARVQAWLEELEEAGLAARQIQKGDTGRPATVWRAL